MSLQLRVWRVFRRAMGLDREVLGSILFTGDGITLCNNGTVIPTLAILLQESRTGSHLVHGRLKDCVRPIQLLGWASVDKERLKGVLSPAATAVTGNKTLSANIHDHDRRTAWDTALSAGLSDVEDWLSAVIVETSGPFERRDALTFSWYFQLHSWPELAERLVLEEFRLEERRGIPIADRKAGVEFFFAVGTFEALRVILGTGITAQGSPLRSTAQSAAELATWLAQSDANRVVQELLKVCDSPEFGSRRMLAIASLESLADRHLIPASEISRLAHIAQDRSLPGYATGAAIWSASCYAEATSFLDYVEFLIRNATDSKSELEVRFQSLQSLVRLEIWRDYEEIFITALDLIGPSVQLTPSMPERYEGWQALLLTQLAIREPDQFLHATLTVINKGGSEAVAAVLQVCTRTHVTAVPVLKLIGNALIARTLQVFNSHYAEGETLGQLARLVPNAFVNAKWEEAWGNWMPEGRAALARAIERNVSGFDSDESQRILALLESLLSDSVYQVRRIAARVFATININKLSSLCDEWSNSGNSGLRLRAAEIAQYLPMDDKPSMDNIVLRILEGDPEKRIREAAQNSIKVLRNRVWAAQLLTLIRAGRARRPNEWVAECYRYGRALIAIGDDESLDGVSTLLSDESTPPNVRNWLRSVADGLDERWKEIMRSWPEPSLPWVGTLEEVKRTFTLDGRHLSSRLVLWRQPPLHPRAVLSWGGSFIEQPGFEALRYLGGAGLEPRSLQINGRTDAKIWIGSVGTHGLVSFVGTGPYPEPLPHVEPRLGA